MMMNNPQSQAPAQDPTTKSLSTMSNPNQASLQSNDEGSPAPERNAKSDGDQTAPMGKIRKPRFKKVEHKYPVEPRVIQVIKKPKTYMDHSYRDFSQVPPEMGYVHPTNVADMTFAQKVHYMLSDDTVSNWIHWLPHGRAFKIAVPKRLEQSKTLQRFFGHNRYSSFLRQLNNHGFKHITKGADRNCYYHECMLRGMPHLAQYMPPGRDARRLMADPDNEPDFYAIDRLFPLGDGNKIAMGNPLLGFGGQNQLNPLLGGLGNFQQLPAGLLTMAAPAPAGTPQAMGMSQGPLGGGNFNQAQLGQMTTMGNLMLPSLQQQPQHQGNNMNDPKLLAALLQQQQQQQQQQQVPQMQQPMSTQRAQSSLMRFM